MLNASNFKEIVLIQIDKVYAFDNYPKYQVAYCKKGNVEYFEPQNIINFFKNAIEFEYYPMIEFCTFPCVLTGKIKLDSKIYDFKLNEGGYATLKGENEERYFGDEKLRWECGV